MGIGDWGLGIGDWGLGPIPNPHYIYYKTLNIIINIINNFKYLIFFKVLNMSIIIHKNKIIFSAIKILLYL